MILKEIDLDLPNSDKHSRFSFRNEVRCIAAQYYGFLKKKISTDGFWKILVECIDDDDFDDVPVTYLKVNTIKVSFDYKKYLTSTKLNKKKMILDALHRGVLNVCSVQGWEPDIFESSKELVISSGYDFFWMFKKPKKNQSKNYQASVICHHDLNNCS